MFDNYIFSQKDFSYLTNTNLISFAYSEITDEPSIVHSHPYTEVLIPKNNRGILFCGMQSIPIDQKSIYIVNPSISHSESNIDSQSTFKYFTIKLKDIIITRENETINKKESDDFFSVKLENHYQEIHNYLTFAATYTNSAENEDLLILNLSAFFCKFKKIVENAKLKINHMSSHRQSGFIQESKNYISQNYGKDIKVEDIAKQYGISYSSFTKKFRQSFGISPKNYLLEKRMEAARYLLSASDYTVSQIAAFCGFTSAAYFTYYFGKMHDQTPKEFRKSNTTPPRKTNGEPPKK